MAKANYRRSLNLFEEFPQIYRKYLNRQIFYNFLLIFIQLEQQFTPAMRNAFIDGAPTYVCHFFHLSIRPFARHVISGTVYLSYQHIF